jgi:hypothetical protein
MKAGCTVLDYYTLLIDNNAFFKSRFGIDVATCYLVSPPTRAPDVTTTTITTRESTTIQEATTTLEPTTTTAPLGKMSSYVLILTPIF